MTGTAQFIDDAYGTISASAAAQGIQLDDYTRKAIKSIQDAAIAEGIDPTSAEVVTKRVGTFFGQLKGILSTPGGWQGQMTSALDAARSYVGQNHEVQGAISTTQGLLKAFKDAGSGKMNPLEISLEFAGPLIAVAVPGAGAAIVAGLAIADSLLKDLIGPKPGVDVCSIFHYTGGGTVDFAIGCMAVLGSGGPISPGNKAFWRSFPEPKNPDDQWWFQTYPREGTFTDWKHARWIPVSGSGHGNLHMTPMDAAFGTYMLYSRDPATLIADGQAAGAIPANLSDEQRTAILAFTNVVFQAWKSNKEWWLNGRTGANDRDVVQHALTLWNRTHLPGQGVDISQPNYTWISNGHPFNVQTAQGPHQISGPTWTGFVSMITHDAPPEPPIPDTAIISPDGTKLRLNTGGQRPPVDGTAVHVKPTPVAQPRPVIRLAGVGPAAHATLVQQVAATKPPLPVPLMRIERYPWSPAVLGVSLAAMTGWWLPLVAVGAAGSAWAYWKRRH